MSGRSRFRFRYRGFILGLAQNLAGLFDKILNNEEDAGYANAFYNPQDLTSLRVGTDGSGGSPAVGDPVGMMLDSSGVSGTMEQFIDSQPDVTQPLAELVDVLTVDWTPNGAGYELTDNTGGQVRPGVEQSESLPAGTYQMTINVRSISGASQIRVDKIGADQLITAGVTTFQFTLTSANTPRYRLEDTNTTIGDGFIIDSITVKAIPGYHAIAPSDAARPTLYDDPDTTWGPLTNNGQRGGELLTNGQFYSATNLNGWNQYGTDANNTITLVSGEGVDIVGDGTSALRLEQTNAFVANGDYYELEIDATVNPSDEAGIKIQYAGTDSSIGVITASGIHKFTFQPNTSTLQIFRRLSGSVTDVRIRNISVRKVLTAFDERGSNKISDADSKDLSSGWSGFGRTVATNIATDPEGGQTADSITWDATGNAGIARNNISIIGTKQRIRFWARVDSDQGSFNVLAGSGTVYGTYTPTTEWQQFEFDYTPSTSTQTYPAFGYKDAGTVLYLWGVEFEDYLYPNLITNGTFDTDSDWTKGTGWSIGSGVASASSATGTLQQTGVATANKWYRIQFYISAYTGGTVTPNIGGVSGASYNSTGWKSEILRANGTPVNFLTSSFTGSIDNVSVQELPSTTPRSYYLDTDGADDWMQVSPTLDLGEQWWHVGGWQSDSNGSSAFATSSALQGGLRELGGDWSWYTGSSSFAAIAPGAQENTHVLTIEQAGTNTISGRFDGGSDTTLTPHDDSAATQGLALFSQQNNAWLAGLDGRFYGGAWGQGDLTADDRDTTEEYIASLARVTL